MLLEGYYIVCEELRIARTWLATVRNVRTAIMTSNGNIFIPELDFQ